MRIISELRKLADKNDLFCLFAVIIMNSSIYEHYRVTSLILINLPNKQRRQRPGGHGVMTLVLEEIHQLFSSLCFLGWLFPISKVVF